MCTFAPRKYLMIFKITLQEFLVYRLNFLLWRFRNLVFFLSLIIFWQAVYGSKSVLFNYQKSQMISYVIGVVFLRSLILASRTAEIAEKIKKGELNRLLLLPIKIKIFWLVTELADKSLNVFFSLLEILLVFSLFRIDFYLPVKISTYIVFFAVVFLSLLLYFFISLSVSLLAFWTDETWAARFLFTIIFLEFLSGAFFPIDVLPAAFSWVINLTPFPYLIFFPLKIWLEQLPSLMILKTLVVCLFWVIVFYQVNNHLWKKGFEKYGAFGG